MQRNTAHCFVPVAAPFRLFPSSGLGSRRFSLLLARQGYLGLCSATHSHAQQRSQVAVIRTRSITALNRVSVKSTRKEQTEVLIVALLNLNWIRMWTLSVPVYLSTKSQNRSIWYLQSLGSPNSKLLVMDCPEIKYSEDFNHLSAPSFIHWFELV